MLSWQGRARLLTVAVAVTVSAAVLVTTRRRQAPPVPPSVARADPAAVVESSGTFVRDVKGERERFRVEAGRQLTYSNGTTKLTAVKVTIIRGGKTFVVKGDEAQVGEKQSSVQLNGHVHLEGSDGLKLDAASASYSEGEGIVRAPGPVTFSRGSMTGRGTDFTYDNNRDTIALSDQTAIKIAPDEKDKAGADISAGAAILARKDRFMSFERAVHIIRGAQVIDADRAVADLTEDEKHVTALDMNGSSKLSNSDAAPGGLRSMAAANISLTYASNSELLERAVLSTGSSVKIAGDKGVPDKTLAADAIDIRLAPDGATVTSMNARDKVALDLPAPKGEASKSIRSTNFVASGDAGHGLTAAVFSDGVEYREFGGVPPVQRLVRARTLDAALNNGLNEIRNAVFTGNAQFADGSTRATAATVRYEVPTGQVELTGKTGNAVPHVTTDQIAVDAGHIDLTLAGPKMKGTDAVAAVLQPSKPAAGGAPATKMPGLMQQDRPANASSKELVYNGGTASKAEFSGNAQLWQSDTRIQGDTIEVDSDTGNLSAKGKVRAKFPVDSINATTKRKETVMADGSGDEMLYDDAARKATFRSKAHLNGPDGDITADVVAVSLAKEGNGVEKLEAEGALTLKETTRVTTGEKLLYVQADNESYAVTGKPARMVEKGCHVNTGTTLAFEKSTDKLRIDGNEETRSQTKTEGKCIESHD
jgi:LPS export ABC transporter protein LptC